MDSGPLSQRRATSRKRVSSPSAAKRGAEIQVAAAAFGLWRTDKVLLDQRHLYAPTLLVSGEGLRAPGKRDLIEAGLGDGQHDTIGNFLKRKGDERRRFGSVVDAGLHGAGMPPEREEPLGLDLLNRYFERDAFIFLLGASNLGIDGSWYDHGLHDGSGRERAVKLHAEPDAEFRGVRYRTPDSLPGRMEKDFFLDAVGIHATSWLHINIG